MSHASPPRPPAGKALLKLGYACNNNCLFCHSAPLRHHPELTRGQVRTRMLHARRAGAAMVVFSGGEPTMRPDILALAGDARRQGLSLGLVTNGRRFVYPEFGKALARAGLEYVYMSFYAHEKRLHRRLTGTDSFCETLGAVRNLSRLGLELTINTVVSRQNIGALPAITDLLVSLGAGKVKLSVMEPKGAALANASLVCPPLSRSAAAIQAAIARGTRLHPGVRFACEGLPPCLLPDFERFNDDLQNEGFTLFQESFEETLSAPDYRNRARGAACSACGRRAACPGIFSGYLELESRPPLRPLPRRRAS